MHETIRDLKIKSLEQDTNLRKFAKNHIGELTSIQLYYLECRTWETSDPIETRGGFNLTPSMGAEEMVENIKDMFG